MNKRIHSTLGSFEVTESIGAAGRAGEWRVVGVVLVVGQSMGRLLVGGLCRWVPAHGSGRNELM